MRAGAVAGVQVWRALVRVAVIVKTGDTKAVVARLGAERIYRYTTHYLLIRALLLGVKVVVVVHAYVVVGILRLIEFARPFHRNADLRRSEAQVVPRRKCGIASS